MGRPSFRHSSFWRPSPFRPGLWRHAPVLLGMALLLLPAAAAVGNALWPGAIAEPPLFGVQAPAPSPAPDAAGLWSGAFQRGFARRFAAALPLLPTAVRLKNQAYFSLLRQSGVPEVAIGKHLQLYEPGYIDEYCSRDTAAILAAAAPWADELAALQRWYAAQGKVFLYILTPAKPSVDPKDMPDAWACRSPPSVRDALLPAWDALLDRRGVRHVDAAAIVRQARRDPPFAMFPRGGTHWNDFASTLAAQAVVRAVNAAGGALLPDFSFTWRMGPPGGVARDLTDLLNLLSPRLDYQVPVVALTPLSPPGPCRPPLVAVVGGSFTFALIDAIERLPCPPEVAFYVYYQVLRAHYPGDVRSGVDAGQRADDLLRGARIVILEENEQVAMRSRHGPALYGLVRREGAMPP